MTKLVISPVSRVHGHLRVEATVDGGKVAQAWCSGGAFRGIELALEGRDPKDAQRFTQRICGTCSSAHSVAAALALDMAYGYTAAIPANGRIIRNLIAASGFVLSHLEHFYQLAAPDYVDFAAVSGYRGVDPALRQVAEFVERGELAPFAPRDGSDFRLPKHENAALVSHYVGALAVRRNLQELLAVFGGKAPHDTGIFFGGTLATVTVEKVAALEWRLARVRRFLDEVLLPDVWMVARAYPEYFACGRGPDRFLSFGAMEGDSEAAGRSVFAIPAGTVDGKTLTVAPFDPGLVREEVQHAWYRSGTRLHPSHGATEPDPQRTGAYSFVKAPRYADAVHEVGPVARTLVAYAMKQEDLVASVDRSLSSLGRTVGDLPTAMGRHVARALEAKRLADSMVAWSRELQPGEPTRVRSRHEPQRVAGVGLTEGPDGAVGHWLQIEKGVIGKYQVLGASTWNCSPRDDRDEPGACEAALVGTKVKEPRNPLEVGRIVRSFGPCLACAVH